MADKSFGVKELNLLGTGTPTIVAPNQLNLNANTVAISTSATIGQNLTVSSNAGIASLNVTGVATVINFNATGISTIAQPADSNPMVNWTVTNNGASAFRFTGPGQSGTEDNPDIYLVRGHRYIFKHNATASHPIQIRVSNGGAAYTDGITYSDTSNNRTTSGNNLTFNVQHDAPAQLVYQCTSHGGMVGNIYIVGQHLANGADNRVLTATSAYGMTGESTLTYNDPELKIDTTSDRGVVKLDGALGGEIQFTKNGTDKLYIYNAEQETRIKSATGAANVQIMAGTDTDNYAQLFLQPNGTGSAYINSGADIVIWTTPSNSHTRFKTNGNIEVDDGDILMKSGRGISFADTSDASGATSVNELFDDYEEGLFTPSITSGGSSISYSIQRGSYTKIGDIVNFQIDLYLSGTPDGNNLRIGGLPFTTANQATKAFGGAFLNYSAAAFSSIGDRTLFHLVSQNTYMQIYNAVTGNVVAGTSTGVDLFNNKEICLTGLYKAS